MSKSSKLYSINLDTFNSVAAQVAKLPKQQQIILRTMAAHCTETGMKGSDIIAQAVKTGGLETRQKYTVLYAWYARSNEAFGVSAQKTGAVTVAEVPAATKSMAEAIKQHLTQ